jgi:pyruvate dehydrogenase kinase 2/3/4
VIVTRGEEDIAIKVEDEGGGIARSRLADAWSYRGSWTSDEAAQQPSPAPSYGDDSAPLSMHGLGLPLSRLYAKYFGGTLHLTPMEGYGTDCYVRLNRLGDHNCENLPAVVSSSPGEADSRVAAEKGQLPLDLRTRSTGSLFDAQARRRCKASEAAEAATESAA